MEYNTTKLLKIPSIGGYDLIEKIELFPTCFENHTVYYVYHCVNGGPPPNYPDFLYETDNWRKVARCEKRKLNFVGDDLDAESGNLVTDYGKSLCSQKDGKLYKEFMQVDGRAYQGLNNFGNRGTFYIYIDKERPKNLLPEPDLKFIIYGRNMGVGDPLFSFYIKYCA